ncbi:NAD(P)-binding domain-containing protein [Sulfuritalea sp.]|uniref:NAD(P)-dependent oxidoreductase n=1 Tax=Sulfuritalea sp. TaxID=2480090 RepID=UPI001AC539FD|nr:NAD(P)-binding domain-containing protein [Sulfuritalea sp.]MBN8476610.1 NAD(P)-dependent oxidoreductase [Sulfuritalea sp.]
MAIIAFLGTGLLGAAFAEAAAQRGDRVTVWNRSASKAQALAQFGITIAATPAEAVRGASRVHLVLKDDPVVDDIIAAARAGLSAGAVIVDHSTTLPTLTAARAAKLAAAGVNYLHCPVFMTPLMARNARGSMLAAGPAALFEAVKADLAAMTGRLEYQGERSDLAAAKKLFGNALILSLSAAMADVLTLAQACDVPGQDAIGMMELLDLNMMVATRGANMARGDFPPSFELAMARKDVSLMLETAGARPLALLHGIAARMDQLLTAGHGADDVSVLAIDAVQR